MPIDHNTIGAMRDEMSKIASKKEERKSRKRKKSRKSSVAHKYIGPALGSAVTGGTMGLALSDKGQRLAKAKKGAAAGIAGALLWKAVTRGYSKATGVPYKEVVASVSQQNINYTASMETKASNKTPDPLGYAAGIEDGRSRASYPVTQSTSKGRYIKPPKGRTPTIIDFKPYNSDRKLPISEPHQHGAAYGLIAKAPTKIKKAWAVLAKKAFATQPISTKPLDVQEKAKPVTKLTPTSQAGAPKGPQAKRIKGVSMKPLTKAV